jgi:L-aspartate oxidase
MNHFDYLVLGGGIAGLTYALEVAKAGTVAVIFKKGIQESSTSWAQGGVAAVTAPDDDFDLHIQDTLVAGAGLCARSIVELVVREAPERVAELIKIGTNFDRDETQDGYHLHKEGGMQRVTKFRGHYLPPRKIMATSSSLRIRMRLTSSQLTNWDSIRINLIEC